MYEYTIYSTIYSGFCKYGVYKAGLLHIKDKKPIKSKPKITNIS